MKEEGEEEGRENMQQNQQIRLEMNARRPAKGKLACQVRVAPEKFQEVQEEQPLTQNAGHDSKYPMLQIPGPLHAHTEVPWGWDPPLSTSPMPVSSV